MKKFASKVVAVALAVVMIMSLASFAFAASDTIKVGILAPLTGGVAKYGNAVYNGAVMYFEELNANGGINGKQIELVTYDEEGDPVKAVTGYNYLMDQGVVAIVGDVTTNPTLAVVAESQADGTPMITASATAAEVTCQKDADGNVIAVYENMFRSCFIDPFQGNRMAVFAKEALGAKTAAILYNMGDDYSVGCYKAFKETAEQNGIEIVADESFADGAVDYQSQLTNIAAKAPDVLFVPVYDSVVALMAPQAYAAGVKATLLGSDGWDSALGVVTDPSLLNGAYYCSGYSPDDTRPEVQTFVKNYTAKYNAPTDMFCAQGYDAAMILAAALEKAEASGAKYGSDDYRQAIIDAMKATDMDCVTGHVTYDQYNNPEKAAVIISIQDGVGKFFGNY